MLPSSDPLAVLTEIGAANVSFAFEMLDHYAGPVSERQHWLADQWTTYGEDISDERWAELETDASVVIAAWLLNRAEQRRTERTREFA